jgi:hypothetical protein
LTAVILMAVVVVGLKQDLGAGVKASIEITGCSVSPVRGSDGTGGTRSRAWPRLPARGHARESCRLGAASDRFIGLNLTRPMDFPL